MHAAITARLPTCALPRHEREHLVHGPGIQDMFRLNPASPCRADAETHLTPEKLGAVAVAVDDDGHAGGCGAPGDGAIHVEMARCAIDLHRGPRRGGGGEDGI